MRLPPKPRKPDPLAKLLCTPQYTEIPPSILPHAHAVPLGVMVRGLLEWLLDEPTLEQLFQKHAPEQYTRELTISALVGLLIPVSAGTHRSVYAAYKADQATDQPTIGTSYQALYTKLARLNTAVSEAIVRHSAEQMRPFFHSDMLKNVRRAWLTL